MRILFSPLCGWAPHRIRSKELQGYLTYKNPPPLGPCRRLMPRVLWGSQGAGRFLTGEVPLYRCMAPEQIKGQQYGRVVDW